MNEYDTLNLSKCVHAVAFCTPSPVENMNFLLKTSQLFEFRVRCFTRGYPRESRVMGALPVYGTGRVNGALPVHPGRVRVEGFAAGYGSGTGFTRPVDSPIML